MDTDLFDALFKGRLMNGNNSERILATRELTRRIHDKEIPPTDIPVIIHTFIQDFVYNNDPKLRGNGLEGLRVFTTALGPGVAPYLNILIPPILSRVNDPTYHMPRQASQLMYDIADVAEGEMLRFFNSIFESLCKLDSAASSPIYKSDIFDRRIKEIVSELSTTYVSPHQQPYDPIESEQETANLVVPTSLPRNTAFSLPHFIPALTQRIYARNSSTRKYIMTWITLLNSIPDLKFISFLPDILDGLLDCLSDPSEDVRTATSGFLDEFLQEIKQAAAIPKEESINEIGNCMPGQDDIVRYDRIVKVLVERLSLDEEDILKIALQWINEFIGIAKDVVIEFAPLIIKNICPCLAHPTSIIRNTAIEISNNLQTLGFDLSAVSRDEEEQAVETQKKHNGNVVEDPVQTGSDNGSYTALSPYDVVSAAAITAATTALAAATAALAALAGHLIRILKNDSEEQLEHLLNDRNFRLVQSKSKSRYGPLTIFTPALHPKFAKDVKRERWACIVCTKGDIDKHNELLYVPVDDDEKGHGAKLKMNDHQYLTITQQLQCSGKYWWIDTMCTQPDTPLWIKYRVHDHCNSCMTLPPSIYKSWRHELLRNPKLRLLKVEHGETQIDQYRREIKSLTVVTPALDPKILEDAMQRGWHCLSHLWGPPSEWREWGDSGVVDGVTGEAIKPSMHPDKRDEIIKLLQLGTRYWWIDIFCAQSDTPLVIMGDIYKNCTDCYTLADCTYELFDCETVFPMSFAAQISEYQLEEAAHGYLDTISKEHRAESGFVGWSQVLNDLLLWPSNRSQQYHDSFLKHNKNAIPEKLYNMLKKLVDTRFEAAQFSDTEEPDPSEFEKRSIEHILMGLQASKPGNLNSAQRALAEFLDCRWMGRIWTLQEIALPDMMYIPSGHKTPNVVSSANINYGSWKFSLEIFLKVIMMAHDIRATPDLVKKLKLERMKMRQTPRQTLEHYQSIDPVLARIYTDYRKVVEAIITIGYSCSRLRDEHLARKILLNSFATSQRTALYPADYVYGVLGVLDIDIPRLTDHDELWQLFSGKIREHYPDIYVPANVDLTKATKMEDVYGGFGFLNENYVSDSVAEFILKVSII